MRNAQYKPLGNRLWHNNFYHKNKSYCLDKSFDGTVDVWKDSSIGVCCQKPEKDLQITQESTGYAAFSSRLLIQSWPYTTANLYCICLSKHEHVLKQMQYRFAVIYETLSICLGIPSCYCGTWALYPPSAMEMSSSNSLNIQ